jgi:hypothetical protein
MKQRFHPLQDQTGFSAIIRGPIHEIGKDPYPGASR